MIRSRIGLSQVAVAPSRHFFLTKHDMAFPTPSSCPEEAQVFEGEGGEEGGEGLLQTEHLSKTPQRPEPSEPLKQCYKF